MKIYIAWDDEQDIAVFAPRDPADAEAVHTAAELTRIHTEEINREIAKVIASFDKFYRKLRNTTDPIERARCLTKLRRLCSRDAPYTMMVRSVARKTDLISEIPDLFDT